MNFPGNIGVHTHCTFCRSHNDHEFSLHKKTAGVQKDRGYRLPVANEEKEKLDAQASEHRLVGQAVCVCARATFLGREGDVDVDE